jgi:hypothetical protein
VKKAFLIVETINRSQNIDRFYQKPPKPLYVQKRQKKGQEQENNEGSNMIGIG